MKKIRFGVYMLFLPLLSLGQEIGITQPIVRNTLYGEAFGQGFCWSLNYDRLLNTDKKVMNSVTTGLVYVPTSLGFGGGVYYGIPVSYNWLVGKKSHRLEMGVGLTALFHKEVARGWSTPYEESYFFGYLTPKIGYRFQRPRGGLFFRATASPMIDLLSVRTVNAGTTKTRRFSSFSDVVGLGQPIFPWPGVSIGYTFK